MDKEDLDRHLAVARNAALAGGEVLKTYWGKLEKYREKSATGDMVTQADEESEAVVIRTIREAFPEHGILAEESGLSEAKDKDFLWIVDPLDGTTNYVHVFPMVAVSIGLMVHGELAVGVVFNPISNELFEASQGQGAFLNGEKIQVSQVDDLQAALLGTGFAYDRRDVLDNNYKEFCHLTNCSQGVRRMGAAALDLAFVAAGRLDGFWELGLQAWDIAAGALLVQEAGGRISSYEMGPVDIYSGKILATNGRVHEQLSREVLSIK